MPFRSASISDRREAAAPREASVKIPMASLPQVSAPSWRTSRMA